MNSSASVCPKCGTVSVLTATKGVCPRCLFGQLEDPLAPEGREAEAGGANACETSTGRSSEPEFGDYELFEEIGQGGMGVVYRARQVSLNRPVAVKVIKLGMDSRKIIARFEAERQALALMDHPAIARVFDAGATRTGRPYFVMELVRGLKITEYCEQHHFSTNERLNLFVQVCHAVQHAHQKGIIHRDLKPSNILVTELDGRPLPKIIDFGIAKATEGRPTEETLFTVAGHFIGTPAYLSPEQAEWGGVDIDTRSDIYSLGVLLYELLTGCLPFEPKTLAKASLDEIRRTIREITPVRPSTRLTQKGKIESGKQKTGIESAIRNPQSAIDRDLDWIVMKCLEKERGRRYETANGLAEDLRRHLHNEPVLARPPSRLYEFQKTVRRHMIGFAASATVFLLLAVGVLVSSWQASRATHAEKRAQDEELAARQRAYLADMWALGESLGPNLARARRLLNDYLPHPGEEDVRDFEWYYFKRVLSEDESEILGPHPGGAMTLLAGTDGTFITAGNATKWALAAGELQIWDALLGKSNSSFTVPEDATGIALSHDGKRLAIAHRDLDIELRSMDQPDQVQTVLTNWHQGLRHYAWTMAMCFVDHDTQLAVGDRSVNAEWTSLPLALVQIATDRTNQSLPFKPPLGLRGLSVSRDGRRLAVKDRRGRILVLDFPEGKPVCSIKTQDTWGAGVDPAMTFLNNPNFLVTTSVSGRIDVWDLATTNRRTLGNHGGFVTALALSPDGKRLASASLDQRINVWDPYQSEQPPLRVLRGHTDRIFGVGFLSDGHTLVSCGADPVVRQWDLRRPRPDEGRWTLPQGANNATLAPRLLGAIAPTKGKRAWKVWDVSDLSEPFQPRPILPPASMPGALVAPLLGTPYHLVWSDSRIGQMKRMFLYRGLDPPEPVPGFPEIRTGDDFIQFKNQLLMVHGASNGVPYDLVWDLAHSRVVHLVKSPMGFGNVHAAFASDGSFVILSVGGRLEKLDLATGVSDVWEDATPGRTAATAILPDNRTILTGGGLGALCKLDFRTRLRREVIGSPTQIRCMCLSPSGTRLATGDFGGNVKLWDVQTLSEVALLGTHPGPVTGLCFAPDGHNLLSVDATELRVWRTADRGSPK